MKCKDIEKLIFLKDSEETTETQNRTIDEHLISCNSCRNFACLLTQAKTETIAEFEPPIAIVQEVKREIRQRAPQKKMKILWLWTPVVSLAASILILLSIFVSPNNTSQQQGLELTLADTQLLETEEVVTEIMTSGLTEDDQAFNFLMTYDG